MQSVEEKAVVDALRVWVRDPYISDWLKLHDPMGYMNAKDALEKYEEKHGE